MDRSHRSSIATRALAAAGVLATLSGCSTTTTLVPGQQASITGDVVSVDTRPWTYDGPAVVVVATATAGRIRVMLPARWNLCRAAQPDNVQSLQPRDRVQASGTVSTAGALVVCEQPQHYLRRSE